MTNDSARTADPLPDEPHHTQCPVFNGRWCYRDACDSSLGCIELRRQPPTINWQAEWLADRTDIHPWYGPCDGLMSDGACAECSAVRFQPGYAATKHTWWSRKGVSAT